MHEDDDTKEVFAKINEKVFESAVAESKKNDSILLLLLQRVGRARRSLRIVSGLSL